MHYLQCPFDPPPTFINAGLTVASAGWRHPRRRLDSHELLLGRKGFVPVDEEGEQLAVRPGQMLLLTAGRYHGGPGPIDAPASFYWLHFRSVDPPSPLSPQTAGSILASREVAGQRLAHAALIPQTLALPDPAALENIFRDLLHEQEEPCYTPYRLQLLLHVMLVALTQIALAGYAHSRKSSATTGLVYAAIADIADHLTDPDLSIKAIAHRLARNPDYLGREFRLLLGTSVGEYILRRRIRQAEEFLRNGTAPMSEVALRSGFSTTRHFQRQFHRYRGMSPSEYRAQQQAIHITTA
jgi:AraC-like DNA-binding protein